MVSPPGHDSSALPHRIGDRYEVVRRIGRGGMSTVYEALDTNSQRRLALKQFRPSTACDPKRARVLFEREFHTLSQLSHPCIVTAFDFGHDDAGPYYTMELIEGDDLRALAPMPWREACGVLRDVASALAVLHARRLVHRDIAYRNVRRPAGGRAKLLDFGALATFGVAAEVVGTAPFISPEALRGQRLDARSDLYSLGCLAYWLLTGRLAFDARNNDELESLWARGAPPPSATAHGVPEALDALVAALMHIDPLARPQIAADVISQLSALADLTEDDPRSMARAYLASPRLVARDRDLERIRRRIAVAFERPTTLRPGAISSRHRARRSAGGSRATLDMGPRASTSSTRQPNIVCIRGGPGTGRTRVLQNVVVESKVAGARAVSVSAAVTRQAPYELAARLVDVLRSERPEIVPSMPAETRLLIEGLRSRPESTASERAGQPIALQERRVKIASALADLFEAAAGGSGLVIAVDDIHRCDEPSASALMAIAARGSDHSILVAMTRDIDASACASSVVDWLEARAACVDLRPLDSHAVVELVRSLFGDSEHVRKLSKWLYRVSAGNPLACVESLEHLIDQGAIRYDGGVWLLPKDPAKLTAPESLTAILRARVDGLSPRALVVAEVLSLFDTPLPLDQCLALAGESTEKDVFDAVDELILRGVVVGEGTMYQLASNQVREVLRCGMDETRRTALHRRLGEMMLAQWPRSTAGEIETAYHLIEGGEAARAAAMLGKLGRSNPFFALMAGPRAARVLERALELAPEISGARRLALQMPLLMQRADLNTSDARLGEAVIAQLSREIGFDLLAELPAPAEPRQRIRRAIEESQRRFDATPKPERGLPPLEALVRLPACSLLLTRMHALAYDIVALQRLAGVVEPYRDLGGLGTTVHDSIMASLEALQGRSAHARQRYDRMLTALEPRPGQQLPYPPIVYHLWRCEIMAAVGIRCADEHQIALEQVRGLEASGFETHRFEATLIRTLVHLRRGEQTGAEALTDELEERLVQHRGGWHHAGWLTLLKSAAYSHLGDTLALKQCVSRLGDLLPVFPNYRPMEQTTRGYYLYHIGDHRGALAIFDSVLGSVAAGEHAAWIQACRGRALALVAQERHGDALAFMEQALARADEVGVAEVQLKRPLTPMVHLCRAEQGQPEAAGAALDAEIDRLQQTDAGPLLLVQALCARARIAALQKRADLKRAAINSAERQLERAESHALSQTFERWRKRIGRRDSSD